MKSIDLLDSLIKDPTKGLPEEIFLFMSRITPLVNVDLLIKNQQSQTLLTWRDDGYFSAGWHIPGGIVRYKELSAQRIKLVAANELGSRVKFDQKPLAIKEVILPSMINRAHAISFLYSCTLLVPPDESRRYKKGAPINGQWAWHDECPKNLISVHRMYQKFIGNPKNNHYAQT